MRRRPSCLTCARLLHSILFQRPIRSDYEMEYPRASRSSTRVSQARGTRLGVLLNSDAIPECYEHHSYPIPLSKTEVTLHSKHGRNLLKFFVVELFQMKRMCPKIELKLNRCSAFIV